MAYSTFHLAQWHVDPNLNCLTSGAERQVLEPRAMDVLRVLCERHGEVISSEQLLDLCWGAAALGDNPVHKAITQLRRALGDSSATPRFIETIRKRGYRIVAPLVEANQARPDSWSAGSPFRGLEAFEERHAAIFYGRARSAAALRDTLLAQARAGCPMVLVLGPSGSGKTSLIRAGLLPQLTALHADPAVASSCALYLDCADVGEDGVFLALGSVMLDAEADGALLFAGQSGSSLGQTLERDHGSIVALLHERGGVRLTLCIDRFEALLRLPAAREGEGLHFLDVLEDMVRSGTVVLIMACRNDFYPQLTAAPALMALKLRGGHFDLHAPNRDEIGQIIRHPAQAARLHFGNDPASGTPLDDVLRDAATGSPDSLPLLQYCLQELYRQRDESGELRYAAYQDMGGLDGAIGARAELVVNALSAAQAAALPRVLSQLVSVARDDLAVTARRGAWSALRGDAEQELVRALIEARLFVSDLHGEQSTFAIAHEALLRRWPRAVRWIAAHRQALLLRASLSEQAARWQAGGQARDLLLPRGSQVRQAAALLALPELSLSEQESGFIRTSLQRARRAERVRILISVMLVGLALLASALGLTARMLQQQAERHRTEAEGVMGYMLGDFVDKLRPIGKLDMLDDISSRALTYLSGTGGRGDSGAALTQRAKALQVIAEVKIARADPGAATTALLASQALLGPRLADGLADQAMLKILGANAFWLGQIGMDQKDWERAERHFLQYRQLSDQLAAANPANSDAWIEQSYAHNSLGSLYLRRGALQRAAESFSLSVTLKTRALARTPANRSLSADLANSLSWLASAQAKLGRLDLAQSLYERETQLMRTLHEAEPANALWRQRLAFAVWHRADLQRARGQDAAAREDYVRAQAMLQEAVAQDASNRSWQSALYTIELRLLELRDGHDAPAEALAELGALHQRLNSLSLLEPKKLNLRRMLGVTEQAQARFLDSQGKDHAANALMGHALQTLEELHARAPGDQPIRESLASLLLDKADRHTARRETESAKQACLRVRAVLGPIAPEATDYTLLAPWVRAHHCTNDGAIVSALQNRLKDIGFQESTYLRHLDARRHQEITHHGNNTRSH